MYRRMLEVYDLAEPKAQSGAKAGASKSGGDTPCSSVILDFPATSFDFIGNNKLVISDEKGNLIVLKNIHKAEKLRMNLIKTKFSRIRQVKTCRNKDDQFSFMAAVTTDSKMALWPCQALLEFKNDLEELKPTKVVKSKQRLTCLAMNNLDTISTKSPSDKKDKKLLGKRQREESDDKQE